MALPGLKPQQRTRPRGAGAHLLSSAARSVRRAAGPRRPTAWTNRGCVCSCQEADCCWAADTLDRTVFSGCFLFLFLSGEAGSWLFLAARKHLEGPAASTRWQRGEPGRGRSRQGLSAGTRRCRTASHPLSKCPFCLHSAAGAFAEFRQRVQLLPKRSSSLHKKGSNIFWSSFSWDEAGIYNSVCNHATFPFLLCGSRWK